jgi:hypothetical protein
VDALVIGIVILGVAVAIAALIFSLRRAMGSGPVKNGIPMIGNLVSISQTGTTVNSVPLMELVVTLPEGDSMREVRCRQVIDIGAMPRAGDTVRVEVDPANASHVRFVGLAP